MQRQPDGAFVLAQRGGDPGDGCLAVALAPDPRGKLARFSPSASGSSSWPIPLDGQIEIRLLGPASAAAKMLLSIRRSALLISDVTVVVSMPLHRHIIQRLPPLSCPNCMPSRLHSFNA
jgi:hypothetical protein